MPPTSKWGVYVPTSKWRCLRLPASKWGVNIFAVNCQFSGIWKLSQYFLSNIVKSFQKLHQLWYVVEKKLVGQLELILECLSACFFEIVCLVSIWELGFYSLKCKTHHIIFKAIILQKAWLCYLMNTNCAIQSKFALENISYNNKNSPLMQTKEKSDKNSHHFHFLWCERLLISSDELFSLLLQWLCRISSISFYDVSKRMIWQERLNNMSFLQCTTSYTCTEAHIKCVKNIFILHDMFMP